MTSKIVLHIPDSGNTFLISFAFTMQPSCSTNECAMLAYVGKAGFLYCSQENVTTKKSDIYAVRKACSLLTPIKYC